MDIPNKDNHQHAPADLRKEGSAYDLTLLESVASEQIKAIDIDKYILSWASCLSMAATAYTRSVTYRHKS
jgi:hypothetical protein